MAAEAPFPIDLEKLRLFVQVAELGSLTKVAVARDSTQSLISRQIAALERDCGGRLFERTGRGVKLSPFGEEILPRVVRLLEEADALASDMRGNAGTPTGRVSIGIVPSLAQPLVNMMFSRLRDSHPRVRLHFTNMSSGLVDESLAAGKIDLGLLFRYRAVGASEELLGTVDTFLVGPNGDQLTGADSVPFEALDGLPLLLPSVPNGLRVVLDQLAKRRDIRLEISMEADSMEIQKDLAAAGTLHTLLSEHAVLREMKAGMLQAARIREPGLRRRIVLLASANRPLSLAGRVVARMAREIAEELAAGGIWQAPTEADGPGA
jgi:LysR family transcriptional regulator, nitrogen assimilation regulatory protein